MDSEISIILLLIIIFGLAKYINYKQYKFKKPIGDRGEAIVSNKLHQLGSEYVIRNNVHCHKAQIDHLVIYGRIIYVIETKLWGGSITGQYHNEKWKQNKNGSIRYFNNPILQNEYHCRQISKAYRGYKIYNIVVFVNNKNVPAYNCVISLDNLNDYIIKTSNNYYNSYPIAMQTVRKS